MEDNELDYMLKAENENTLTSDDQKCLGCGDGETTITSTEQQISILKEQAELHKSMESRFKDALSLRIQNIDSLTLVVSKIQECEDAGHKGRMYVAASGAVSGVCMVLAPFTGGLSVIPAIPFAVGGIAGSIANTVKEASTKKDLYKEANEFFTKDRDSIEELDRHEKEFKLQTTQNYEKLKRLNNTTAQSSDLYHIGRDFTDGKDIPPNSIAVDTSTEPIGTEKLPPRDFITTPIPKSVSEKSVAKHVGEDLSEKFAKEASEEIAHGIGEDISKSVAKDAGKSTSKAVGHGVGQMLGSLVAGVFVVIDIVELVKSSKKIGKASEAIDQLTQQIGLLRNHEKELNSKVMLHEKLRVDVELLCTNLQFVVERFASHEALSIGELIKINEAKKNFDIFLLEKCNPIIYSETTNTIPDS